MICRSSSLMACLLLPLCTWASGHWAFQAIERPEIPAGGHPIDALIEKKLKSKGFVTTERADRRTLVRRLSFDLLGLPPDDDTVQSERSIESLIDMMLASPRFGERWARHWLDVARYADTKDGVLMYDAVRMRPFAYTYRDYVIRAFNTDVPFDRFVREQIAADQLGLASGAPELAAMGFLTLGRMFDNNPHDVIDDQIDTLTRGFLGLTVSCARCHDHKYDPVPIDDYYSLHGVFASSVQPLDRPRIEAVTPPGESYESELAVKLAELENIRTSEHAKLIKAARARTPDYLERVATKEADVAETAVFFLSLTPEDLRPQITNRWRRLISKRAIPNDPIFAPWHDLLIDKKRQRPHAWRRRGVDERVIKALESAAPETAAEVARVFGQLIVRVAEKAGAEDPIAALLEGDRSPTWFPERDVWFYMSRKVKDDFRRKLNGLDILATKSPHAAARAMVLEDNQTLVEPVVFNRGNPTDPGKRVPRRFLALVEGEDRRAFTNGSGRLELARAITSPGNPLTARVIANRIWMHHFGEPLVENPNDFGRRTPKPLHLDVLDFLASELLRSGWQVKRLHRLILTSATYQRASTLPDREVFAQQLQRDPGNTYYWRGSRRRLDFESMRDSLLEVSGKLDQIMYGRPGAVVDEANTRRTVYATVERQLAPEVFRTFDFPSPDSSAAKRTQTTVPQQALYGLNSRFVRNAAENLAGATRFLEVEQRIRKCYRRLFAREPTLDELASGKAFVASESWPHYCQVLLMTNEFLFID